MQAIISDPHANLEASRAVFEDIDRFEVSQIICLGDLVSFGPDPVSVVELVRKRADITLQGPFDWAAVTDGDLAFPPGLLDSILRFRELIDRDDRAAAAAQFMERCPISYKTGSTSYVHGSPRNRHEYLDEDAIYNARKMLAISAAFDKLCFHGHINTPGLLVQWGLVAGDYEFISTADCNSTYCFNGQKALCNVGSVGQPGGDDPRASYVLFDGEKVVFRRVPYDVDQTVKKLLAIPNCEEYVATRLLEGR